VFIFIALYAVHASGLADKGTDSDEVVDGAFDGAWGVAGVGAGVEEGVFAERGGFGKEGDDEARGGIEGGFESFGGAGGGEEDHFLGFLVFDPGGFGRTAAPAFDDLEVGVLALGEGGQRQDGGGLGGEGGGASHAVDQFGETLGGWFSEVVEDQEARAVEVAEAE